MAAIRFTLLCLMLLAPAGLPADDEAPRRDERPPAPEKPRRPLIDVLPRQPADPELTPFEPKSPPTAEEQAVAAGMSWYLTGQLQESRNDFDGARDAYRKAVAANPAALPAYQSLVTIAFAQPGRRDEAAEYAIQAAQNARDGSDLVRGLAALMVRANETADAIQLLERGLKEAEANLSQTQKLLIRRDLGLFAQMSGDSEKALEHFRIVFETLQSEDSPLKPEDREQLLGDAGGTYEQMGKAFLDARLPDLAVTAFEEAAKFNKARPGVHSFNLATVYKETGKPNEALEELQKYFDAQLQTKGREAYELLKELLAETGATEQLLPRLEEMQKEDSRNVALRYFLAETYEETDRLDDAEKLYQETLGEGVDPRGLVGLARVYQQKQDAEKLFDILRKGYQVIPQPEEDESAVLDRMDADMRTVVQQFQEVQKAVSADEPVMEKLLTEGRRRKAAENANFEFLDAYLLGKLAAQASLVDAAKEFYQLAIDMQNDPVPALFRELGLVLTDAGRYAEAAEIFNSAVTHTSPRLQADGIRSYFQYLRSHALEMDGQTQAALEAIREARKTQPENPGLHFQEAWVHYHSHDFEAAIAEFEKIIETYGPMESDSAQQTVRNSRYSLSAIYVQLGDEVKGEEILLEVYRKDPDDTQVNNDLGYLWADQGRNLDKARAMIQKALDAEPENPAYLDSMGWVLFRLGEYEEARGKLERAAATPQGQDSTILDHLGDVYDKLGEDEKALESWRKALQMEQADTHPDQRIIDRIKAKVVD
jgi:tetratricopeptide (TPR) repeat protein